MLEKVKSLTGNELAHYAMWVVALCVVGALVGTGKVKPEVLEMILFAVLGKSSGKKELNVPGGSDETAVG